MNLELSALTPRFSRFEFQMRGSSALTSHLGEGKHARGLASAHCTCITLSIHANGTFKTS